MNRSLSLLFLAALLAGCPPGDDDDSVSDDDDSVANDDDSVGDDDDSVGDDDDSVGDDDDSVGDDDDSVSDDDDSVADDDDSVGDDDDSVGGGPCALSADHLLTLTVDPSNFQSNASDYQRFYYELQAAAAGVAVSQGDTIAYEVTFDPPLLPSRDVEEAPMEVGQAAALPSGQAEYTITPLSTAVEPAQPTTALNPALLAASVYEKMGSGDAMKLMVPLGELSSDGDAIECIGASFLVPANVATVAVDAASVLTTCEQSFCEPDLWEGWSAGDDDDSAAPAPSACDMWADNVYEITLDPADFALTNDGSSNGVLRYDADFTDFGITPDETQSYAFVANFTEPLTLAGDWDLVEMYFDNTYPTTNNQTFPGPIGMVQVGSSDLVSSYAYNNAQTNGSALEWRPGTELAQQTPSGSTIAGSVDCLAFGFIGGDYMLNINIYQPPNVTPMSRLTLRADCAGSGAACTGSNEFGFPAAGGSAGARAN